MDEAILESVAYLQSSLVPNKNNIFMQYILIVSPLPHTLQFLLSIPMAHFLEVDGMETEQNKAKSHDLVE